MLLVCSDWIWLVFLLEVAFLVWTLYVRLSDFNLDWILVWIWLC